MSQQGSLRTRKSILDFKQLLGGRTVDERVFGDSNDDQQEGLLRDEIINMGDIEEGWDDVKKSNKPRKRLFISLVVSLLSKAKSKDLLMIYRVLVSNSCLLYFYLDSLQ